MERTNAAAGERRQIARVHDRFAMEAGKKQAEQLDAGHVDGGARGQGGGGVEIIDPATRAVGAQEGFGRIFRRLVHRGKYR